MAENALALMQYLSSTSSPLSSLIEGYHRPRTVYFSHLGFFFMYSFTTAKWLYGILLIASTAFVAFAEPARLMKRDIWWDQARGSFAIFGGIAGAWLTSNIVAAIMRLMGKGMSWFSREYSPMALYGPAAILGMLASRMPLSLPLTLNVGALASQLLIGPIDEQTMFTSLLLTQSFTTFAIQMLGFGSAAMFYLSALPLFFVLILNGFISKNGQISLWTYALGQLSPMLTSTILVMAVSDVFVPLVRLVYPATSN
jgi:hypothetical protein